MTEPPIKNWEPSPFEQPPQLSENLRQGRFADSSVFRHSLLGALQALLAIDIPHLREYLALIKRVPAGETLRQPHLHFTSQAVF